MGHISVGVEYGLHCLLYLTPGFNERGEASVRDLAELQGVPNEFLAKMFTKLAKAGLLVASEGARGGYALGRPASEISVLDVVDAIDGRKPLFDCREIRARCAVFDPERPPAWSTRGVCSIHAVMLAAEQRMREELAAYSLADIADRTVEKAPASHQRNVIAWFDGRTPQRRGERSAG
jgi:Rrf2 family protein